MDLENEALLSFYEDIAPVNGRSDVMLTRHVETGRIFVKKILSTYDRDLYLTLRQMDLPGIPKIALVAGDDDSLTVIEEYVNGTTLDTYLRDNGPLDEAAAIGIASRLCDILEPLHAADPSIIHRDIKPSNIMIDRDLNVTLIDFNAAKRFDGEKNRDTVLMGTVDYAAPEQYGFAQSDARTDIYAIGILLNVMLTGRHPRSELYRGPLSGVISKCISLDPDDRYSSVDDLKEALRPGTSDRSRFIPPGFRSRRPWKMITASLIYILIFYTGLTMQVEGVYSASVLAMYRLTTLAVMLIWIMVFFDYAGICSRIRYLRRRNVTESISKRMLWSCISASIVLVAGSLAIVLMESGIDV